MKLATLKYVNQSRTRLRVPFWEQAFGQASSEDRNVSEGMAKIASA